VAVLVVRLLNGYLHWAALQYPNSEIIQRLHAWINVRQLWGLLRKMLRFQPPSPPEVPYDTVVDIPPLPVVLFRKTACTVMQTKDNALPCLQQDAPVNPGDAITSLPGLVLLCVEWMQGKNEPFPYPDGHVPQDDLDIILANIPGPKQEAFLQWLEYQASVELGPPAQYPAPQVQAGAVNAGLDLLQNYRQGVGGGGEGACLAWVYDIFYGTGTIFW